MYLSRMPLIKYISAETPLHSFCPSQVMCAAWVRFEEEYGTLEDYDRAMLKVGYLVQTTAIYDVMMFV